MRRNSKAGQILGYSFLVVFADNGVISAEELAMMEELALRDQIVDAEEKHVLKVIFERPDPKDLSIEVREEIKAFRAKHNF
ncbi:MAG: hypothetical protein HKN50_04430 [Gammaproteobacteria bacterium]|nr:hypothetical protein [Gammaproteobacteria bacterium]